MKRFIGLSEALAGPLISQKKHSHVALLDEEEGVGYCSIEDEHSHEIYFEQGQEAGVDPETGEEIPAVEGGWIVGPAADGHAHSFIELTRKSSKKESSDELLKECLQLFRSQVELEKDSFDSGEESYDFYKGKQWSSSVKGELEKLNRAALTINYVQRNIDELRGYERQNETEPNFLPVEEGDQVVADILNYVGKQIREESSYSAEKARVFKDMVIAGRGNFNIFVQYDDNLEPKIYIEQFPWKDVFYGEHIKENAEDCEHVTKHKMYSIAKLKQLFGDKAKDIEADFNDFLDPTSSRWTKVYGDTYAYSDNKMPTHIMSLPMIDVERKSIRLLECWRNVYVDAKVAVFPDLGYKENLYWYKAEDIRKIRNIPGVQLVEKSVRKIRITKIAGNTVLSDEMPADLPVDEFLVVPAYANKDENSFWGKVEIVKDVQREKNKRHSQIADIGNKMVAYGWIYTASTFPPGEEQKFLNNNTSPGFATKVNDLNQAPRQVEGIRLPSELVDMATLDTNTLQDLMNIHTEPGGANESGSLFLYKQKQKLQGNEYLFDSLASAERKVWKLVLGFIQRYYTPERILRILSNRHTQRKDVRLGGQSLDFYNEEDILKLLETKDLSSYDVVISENTWSPTIKMGVFAMLSDLAKGGYPISPNVLIEFAPIPSEVKERVLNDLAAQGDAEAAANSEKSLAEVAKPLISKGIIPPKVKEMLGFQDETLQQSPEVPEGIQQ